MIQRVYEQSLLADRLDELVIATDDERIQRTVEQFGGKVMMTASAHPTGTDRVAEVAKQFPDCTHVINIQGDEPFLHPEQIDLLCEVLTTGDSQIATLVKEESDWEVLQRNSVIKVVLDQQQQAMYFSRSMIPHVRKEANQVNWPEHHTFYKHLGMYGFERETLLELSKLAQTPLEQAESLEQLRWLSQGWNIQVGITHLESHSIDTPEDLARLSR